MIEGGSFLNRHGRAIEVGMASALFLLWPRKFEPSPHLALKADSDNIVAAISYTLFPPTFNRPCANPSSEMAALLPNNGQATPCRVASCTVALSWIASWIVLCRVMGLIFPMPEVGTLSSSALVKRGDESTPLLRGDAARLTSGYEHIMAGAAFELGDDED